MEKFHPVKIQLKEIKLATNDFNDHNSIENGAYKGVLLDSKGERIVAFTRLDRIHGQGNPQFLEEIIKLFDYKHENLISYLGYCNEDGENILVHEHASHGSMVRHLGDPSLTWSQRLKICIAAARGLSYLHDPQQSVVHGDIKSSNILLDGSWNAKISYLGHSKVSHSNEKHTILVSNAVVGTLGYCDPLYLETGLITKESDVYSFGVVLFEVLCGRLCIQHIDGEPHLLVPMWRQSYKQENLKNIIFQDMIQQMDLRSLETFSDIAYGCLQRSHEQRPTMAHVVEELERALEFQEIYELVKPQKDYEEVINVAVAPLIYESKVELKMLLSKGILLDEGKKWFWLNKKGEHCEMISAAECLIPMERAHGDSKYRSEKNSRFTSDSYYAWDGKFKARVKTQFLSPQITYAVNLVFNIWSREVVPNKQIYKPIKHKLEWEKRSSTSYLAIGREDGWLVTELYQFTSDRRNVDLEILFAGCNYMLVEGIEFLPVEKVKRELSDNENNSSILEVDVDWEQKLPNDYNKIIEWAKDSLQWTTKQELYFLLCKGFLINKGDEWFSLAKNGKKCHMLSAKRVLSYHGSWNWRPLPESRFEEVAFGNDGTYFIISCKIKTQLLSPETTYAAYFVYKLPENDSRYAAVRVKDNNFRSNEWEDTTSDISYIYLLADQTPVIRPKVGQNTHNPLNTPKSKGLPQLRDDGWMEVQVWEFQTDTSAETISMDLYIDASAKLFQEMILQGIEFKPI